MRGKDQQEERYHTVVRDHDNNNRAVKDTPGNAACWLEKEELRRVKGTVIRGGSLKDSLHVLRETFMRQVPLAVDVVRCVESEWAQRDRRC